MLPNIVFGAIAGTVGVLAMDRVGWFLYRREDHSDTAQENNARAENLDTAHAAANKAAALAGIKLTPAQPHPAGIAVHYALGILPAILLAVFIEQYLWIGFGYGLLYGLILFIVNDEILAPLMRIASRPTRYPWQAHVRGLVAHLVLGVITVTVFRILKALAS